MQTVKYVLLFIFSDTFCLLLLVLFHKLFIPLLFGKSFVNVKLHSLIKGCATHGNLTVTLTEVFALSSYRIPILALLLLSIVRFVRTISRIHLLLLFIVVIRSIYLLILHSKVRRKILFISCINKVFIPEDDSQSVLNT